MRAESVRAPSTGNLRELAALTARGFASTEEATAAVLRLIAEQVGVRSSFLSRVSRQTVRLEVLAAHNAPGGSDVVAGSTTPLPQTF